MLWNTITINITLKQGEDLNKNAMSELVFFY